MTGSMPVSAEARPVAGPFTSRPMALTAGLLAVASVLGLVEAALPGLPVVPWLKLGLANIAVVVALVVSGGRTACVVSIGRVLIVGLAAGTLGSPAFAISAAGATVSLAVMWALSRAGRVFSPIGWSAAGSAAHVAAQFCAAAWVLGSWSILVLAPLSVLLALPLGALTGWLARTIVSRLRIV
ncbi:MAG: Gx transporter family protein [Coriobacteriia bacterium]|nr:Gx transporter family protein [Coriobacteriia bacterium]MBN2840732.1 Gx transporter family protein [Coriobacteriia bacterium]